MLKINQKHLQDLQLRNQQSKNNQSTASTHSSPFLGIDYGAKFCGIAFSPDGVCVFALKVVPTEEVEETLSTLIAQKKIKTLVIGIPISPNNQVNEICQTIYVLAKNWEQCFGIPILFQNEKFSTQEGMKFKTSKEKRADHLAAAKILEYYLETAG